MKSYDSRVYSINDFIEWDKNKQLELNPKFQRRPVWTEKAKAYLIDTIIRGKPIPKVFIRQRIDVTTKTSIRDVVDGQQRLRTIIAYIKDGFTVARNFHSEYGGLLFSQLPVDVQSQILSYEISVDLLINLSDSEVLDIFSRLNSYAVVLNDQERINAGHFGPFKILADKIGHKYYQYWTDNEILTSKKIMRMQEVSLVADLLISMTVGVKAKKQIKRYYYDFERDFPYQSEDLEERFDKVVSVIDSLFPEGLSSTEFRRPHIFYSLFTAVYHCLFGLDGCDAVQKSLRSDRIQMARSSLERIEFIFDSQSEGSLTKPERQFLEDSRRATTDEPVRLRRTKYLVSLIP